jgi:outer membrane biosynthesis protein TonB
VERGETNSGGGFFNSLFASKGQEVAAVPAPSPVTTATVETQKPKSVPHYETAAVTSKPKAEPHSAEPRKTEPQQSTTAAAAPATTATTTTAAAASKPKPASQQQEANAAATSAAPGSLINGAQAVVPSGNFANRWGGLQ